MSLLRAIWYLFIATVIAINTIAISTMIYWSTENFVLKTTTVNDERIVGSSALSAGDVLTINENVTRYRDCTLDVDRIVRLKTGVPATSRQEFIVQHIMQVIEGNGVTYDKPIAVVLPPVLTPGNYIYFSRIRYYCNGLDYLIARVLDTQPLPFTVN